VTDLSITNTGEGNIGIDEKNDGLEVTLLSQTKAGGQERLS
jgi:hypothetical protein